MSPMSSRWPHTPSAFCESAGFSTNLTCFPSCGLRSLGLFLYMLSGFFTIPAMTRVMKAAFKRVKIFFKVLGSFLGICICSLYFNIVGGGCLGRHSLSYSASFRIVNSPTHLVKMLNYLFC